jgi:hypothetical protein
LAREFMHINYTFTHAMISGHRGNSRLLVTPRDRR